MSRVGKGSSATDSGRGPREQSSAVSLTAAFTLWDVHETLPAPILGVGATMRLGGSHLFGELRLPFYQHNSLAWGPNSPLMFGLRF